MLNFLSKNKILYALGFLCLFFVFCIFKLKSGMDILDTKFFYLKSEIQPLFLSLGDEGRSKYLTINILDFGFITTYTLFFYGMYAVFFKNLAKSLIIIPTLLCLADTIETSIIFYLLKTYPETHNTAEFALMFLTPLKWLLALSSLLVIVNGYFVNLYIKK